MIFHKNRIVLSNINSTLIVLGMEFGILFDVFVILLRSRTQPAKPSNIFVSTMNLSDCTILEHMILIMFMILFDAILALNFYECWQRFGLHFGIPLLSNSMFWGDCFLDGLLARFLNQKLTPCW